MVGQLADAPALPRPFGHAISLRRPPLCPEISLWLIDGEVDLEAECRGLHEGESPPYWAFCWGSGQALGRWLLDHPEAVSGLRVVDFGCGSGVAGIAAARAGAAQVTAVDVDPAARQATRANATANRLQAGLLVTAAELPADWDLLLAADVLYEPPVRAAFEELRTRSGARGAAILAGEPERPGHPGHAGAPLERYPVRTFPDVDSPTAAACVYRL